MQEIKAHKNQIIVLESELIFPERKLKDIRNEFMQQLKEGVAIVPNGFKCLIVERDLIML